MSNVMKIHLVFPESSTALTEELSKYCLITGWDNSLEYACNWAREGGGEDPDAFLLNGTLFLTAKSSTDNKAIPSKSLEHLGDIGNYRKKSRIIVLLPQALRKDLDLITRLFRLNIYDFWFLDEFDENDLRAILSTSRTREDAEEYLKSLKGENEVLIKDDMSTNPWRRRIFSPPAGIEQIYIPYYIKSNIIAFWSADDAFLSQGLALLLSVNLAEKGFKVALIEPISQMPSLAGILSMRHPYCNTSHALSMFSQRNNNFIKNCLFNSVKYIEEPNSPEKDSVLLDFPAELYFLPDVKREDNIPWTEMNQHWKEFVTELCRTLIFEQGFHFIIFTCSEQNGFNDTIINELAYTRFIIVNMLPSSIIFAINERKKSPANLHIIGTRQVNFIEGEIKELEEEAFLYPPKTFEEDFLRYVYSKRKGGFTEDTQGFINILTEKTGVRLIPQENKGIKLGMQKLGKILWSSVKKRDGI